MPEYTTTDRGFKHYEPIKTNYGHVIRVYESSAAEGPHVWLAVQADHTANGETAEVHAHMTVEQVVALREALGAAVLNHYQSSPPQNQEQNRP